MSDTVLFTPFTQRTPPTEDGGLSTLNWTRASDRTEKISYESLILCAASRGNSAMMTVMQLGNSAMSLNFVASDELLSRLRAIGDKMILDQLSRARRLAEAEAELRAAS